jgi:hypothetical protein
MVTEIHLAVTVGENRRLDVQLPDDAPIGPVEVTIRAASTTGMSGVTTSTAGSGIADTTRASVRAKMLAAGFLTEVHHAPSGARALSVDERIRAGTLPPGSRPSEELIDEERGAY